MICFLLGLGCGIAATIIGIVILNLWMEAKHLLRDDQVPDLIPQDEE